MRARRRRRRRRRTERGARRGGARRAAAPWERRARRTRGARRRKASAARRAAARKSRVGCAWRRGGTGRIGLIACPSGGEGVRSFCIVLRGDQRRESARRDGAMRRSISAPAAGDRPCGTPDSAPDLCHAAPLSRLSPSFRPSLLPSVHPPADQSPAQHGIRPRGAPAPLALPPASSSLPRIADPLAAPRRRAARERDALAAAVRARPRGVALPLLHCAGRRARTAGRAAARAGGHARSTRGGTQRAGAFAPLCGTACNRRRRRRWRWRWR